jgi:tetratricopeptide (TPR) repeat protein
MDENEKKLYRKALKFYRREKFHKAKILFTQLVEHSDDLRYRINLATVNNKLHFFKEAIEESRKLLKDTGVGEVTSNIYDNLFYGLINLGKIEESIQLLLDYSKLFPRMKNIIEEPFKIKDIYIFPRFRTAKAILKDGVQGELGFLRLLGPENFIENNIRSGFLFCQYNFSDMIRVLEVFIQNNQNNVDLLFKLGHTFLLTKNYKKAFEILTKTLSCRNSEKFIKIYLSNALIGLKKYDEALESLLKLEILKIVEFNNPYSNDYYRFFMDVDEETIWKSKIIYLIAKCYFKKNDDMNAYFYCEKCLSMNKDYKDALELKQKINSRSK